MKVSANTKQLSINGWVITPSTPIQGILGAGLNGLCKLKAEKTKDLETLFSDYFVCDDKIITCYSSNEGYNFILQDKNREYLAVLNGFSLSGEEIV